MNLISKSALVCGASQGIGEAIAIELAQAGADVFLLARTQDKLEALSKKLDISKGQKHFYFATDLNQSVDLQKTLDAISSVSRYPLSIIINNSGGPKSGPLLQASDEDFINGFQAHILAASRIAKQFVPRMKEQNFGRIINIISTSVKVPIANLGVSNTIRGAMANWAKSMANELAPFGITVNNVLPGYTMTPRLESLAEAAAQRQNKTVEDIKKSWMASTPAGRFATPDEVAAAVCFLASPSAGFITGINLPVDGGRTPCL